MTFEPASHPVDLSAIDPRDHAGFDEKETRAAVDEIQQSLYDLHYLMYAENRRSLLVILQGIDASGKDGASRYLARGLNPIGTHIHSFKRPNNHEIDHDYLWRVHLAAPPRGDVAIFNRSHYEEVTTVRVHPELLEEEFLPPEIASDDAIWKQRYRQINDFERMLTENGTMVVKCLLHISKEEQQERFEERIADRHRHWKFDINDLREREYWDDYMRTFEEMIAETSTPWAPWYVIRADRKWFRNFQIGTIVCETLQRPDMEYPPAPGA